MERLTWTNQPLFTGFMRRVKLRWNDNIQKHLQQVEFDAKAANRIADENGEIGREDFFKFAIDTKLLDFGCVMGEGSLLPKQKKQMTPTNEIKGSHDIKSSAGKV